VSLALGVAYWHDPAARAAFKAFMVELFALDFTRWEQAGYWDDAYTPFSIFDGERVVANVCLYLLDAVIDGRATRLAQVSAVGTLPQFRRRGLCRQLTNAALAWAQGRHAGVFLFANDEAVPVYERAGFMPLAEFVERVPTRPRAAGGAGRAARASVAAAGNRQPKADDVPRAVLAARPCVCGGGARVRGVLRP
jgi:GNAT superfamily N-acetyltransferase